MSDAWNLPTGVTPSSIPGNSRREIAISRAMEEADDLLCPVAMDLRELARHFPLHHGPEDAQSTIRMARDALETIQVKLEEASGILDRVTMPDEPEYDPSP